MKFMSCESPQTEVVEFETGSTWYKMRLRNFILSAGVTLLAAGCAMEEIGGGAEEVVVDAPKLYAELMEDAQTKTCIDASALVAGEKAAVLWMPEDQIGVFSTGSSNVLYVNDEQVENVPNTSFSGTAGVSGELKYAYYPYDKANVGNEVTGLSGVVPAKQTMGEQIPGDYKYGELRGVDENGGYRFKFHNLFSLVRFKIDATGTDLAGKTLEKVTLKVARDGAGAPALTGDFTFSAVDGTYTLGETSNMLSTLWDQKLEGEISSFASVFPTIRKGDKLTFTLSTGEINVVFTVTSKVDFEPEKYYTFPLTVATFAKDPTKYGYAVKARPTITSFKFDVKKNEGKLLDNKTEWSSKKPKFTSVSEHAATISGTSVDVMIPYLYDFTLIPTFTSAATVTVGNETVTSGTTPVNFTGPVTLTVNGADEARDYIVNVKNTGLPVVVLKHSKTGNFKADYKDFGAILSGNARNKFVDFMVRPKDADWVEDDILTVYNANGNVDMSTTCGARLRGNTSQDYPKKPFAIKLTSKKSILGMPSHKRWVLLANWLDHSMIRNTVAFDIAHAIEDVWRKSEDITDDGIPWNVHGRNVELVVFSKDGVGHHVGNYFLCEQIKIDENRLNITSPDGSDTGTDYTKYGYLLEVDTNYDEPSKFKTNKGVPFMFKDEVSSRILSSVEEKVNRIEANIYKNTEAGYKAAYEELDINSVIDQMLIWELTMNREYGDPRSVYMFMDGDNKLCAGPVWDFDRGTFQNTDKAANDLGNSDRIKPYDEWMYWRSDETYIWYKQLAKDPIFQAKVKERWAVIHPVLEKDVLDKIESYREALRASFACDSPMWPTAKADIQAHKSGFSDWSGDETIEKWDELIDNFKAVYNDRLSGMNKLIQEGRFTK